MKYERNFYQIKRNIENFECLKKEIDTTGCGDIFAATYTLFRYKNFSTTKSSIAASKIAGLRSGMNKILYKKLKTNILKLLNEKKN